MRKLLQLLVVMVCATGTLLAQKDTVTVQGMYTGGSEGSLNNAVQAAQDGGTISNTVFKLNPYDQYVLTSTIETSEGEVLDIVGPEPGTTQESAPPQILWSSSGDFDTENIFRVSGDLIVRNVWIRYANTEGNQVGSTIRIMDQPGDAQENATFEGVVFEYSSAPEGGSGAVEVTADHFVGVFKNSYFRNCIDVHLRYYGRALSFPYEATGWHIDSVLFENTTFANIGYVYMQEEDNFGDNVHFNHCTFLNVVMFSLESGMWHNMSVTNSIFLNPFMFGYVPAQGDPNGGIFSIAEVDSFGFDVDFTDPERQILLSNVSYKYEDWLLDWMDNSPYADSLRRNREDDLIPQPHPYLNDATIAFMDSTDGDGNRVHPLMNRDNLYIGSNPEFITPATNQDTLKTYLLRKWGPNSDIDWAYEPRAGYLQTWPLPENMAYTNDTLLTAAMGDFPLGDLYNWFPDEYESWEAQRDEEWDRIYTWMETGQDPNATDIAGPVDNLPAEFALQQNYPNPFNPVTNITYSVPRTSDVELKVYNNLGQEVVTLVDGQKSAGSHTATFNGADLPSGIYFYRLQADDVSITKRLVLVK